MNKWQTPIIKQMNSTLVLFCFLDREGRCLVFCFRDFFCFYIAFLGHVFSFFKKEPTLTCLVEVFQAGNEYPLLPSLSQAIHLNIYSSFPLSLQHHR